MVVLKLLFRTLPLNSFIHFILINVIIVRDEYLVCRFLLFAVDWKLLRLTPFKIVMDYKSTFINSVNVVTYMIYV